MRNATVLRRRLFAGFAVLSLILCLATVGLWVRSYWFNDWWVYRSDQGRELRINTFRGRVLVHRGNSVVDRMFGWIRRSELAARSRPLPMFRFDKFEDDVSQYWLVGVVFPHWLPALLFALAPAWWLFGPRRRRAKRRTLGLCLTCGYDLRASPDRCPECGKVSATRLGVSAQREVTR